MKNIFSTISSFISPKKSTGTIVIEVIDIVLKTSLGFLSAAMEISTRPIEKPSIGRKIATFFTFFLR
jgi:hypothetical protein